MQDKTQNKVFLVFPPSPSIIRVGRCQQLIKDFNFIPQIPPMSLLTLASVAENCGYEAKVRDYNTGGNFAKDLDEFKPKFLVVNVTVATFKKDLEYIAIAKNLYPSIITIAYGAPFITGNVNVLYENPFIDYVINCEPELVLQDILNGVPDSQIKGIFYSQKSQGVVVESFKTEPRELNKELDNLPLPARHLIDNTFYRRIEDDKPFALVEVSRGCPNNCFYCLAPIVCGREFRVRSVESIINEIKECIEKYKLKNFMFWSDCFNYDMNWVLDLCNKIIESKLKIEWYANFHPCDIDKDFAKVMYKSGCRLLYMGVESGNEEILKNIGKNTTKTTIENCVRVFQKNRIKIYTNFLVGLPWDNEKTIKESADFAKKLDPYLVSFNTPVPFIGTQFFAYSMLNRLVEDSLNFEDAYNSPMVKTHELSKKDIVALRLKAIKSFYTQPKVILKIFFSKRTLLDIKKFFINRLIKKK